VLSICEVKVYTVWLKSEMASRIVSSATVKAVKGRRPVLTRAALVLVSEEKLTYFACNVSESNVTVCVYIWMTWALLFFRHPQLLKK
jgi:hypothetical protein